jgi:hypothetical protein
VTGGVRSEIARFFGVFVGAFALALWFFRHHWPYLTTDLLGYSLDNLHHLRVYRWQWSALASGDPAGLVDAPTMLPFEHGLAFGDNMLALTLMGWPLALFGQEILAANFVVLVSYVLCAVFCAGFVRAVTGSAGAGLVAGVAWAFQPSRMERIFEPNNMSIMWCALAVWAYVRWLDTRQWRWAFLGGASLYLQFLSSVQMTIHVSLALGLWALASWAARRFAVSRRTLTQIFVIVVAEVVLLIPWARVYTEVHRHLDPSPSLMMTFRHRAELSEYFGAISPGPVVWVLVGVALVTAGIGRVRRARFAGIAALGLFMMVLSLGPFWRTDDEFVRLPYYFLTKIMPIYASVRAPLRMHTIAALFLTAAAAYAIPWMTALVARRWPSRASSAGVALASVAVVAVLATVHPVRSDRFPVPDSSAVDPIRALPEEATLFFIPFHGRANHAIPDYLQTFHRRGMIGGYQSTCPPLFFSLRNATDVFPQRSALDAIAATGATHVLVNEEKVTPALLRRLDAAVADGALATVYDGTSQRILTLPEPGRRTFDPFGSNVTMSLAGPSAVAPRQSVTLALWPHVERAVVDLVPRRRVRVIVAAAGAGAESEQNAWCRSPNLVEPGGRPYTVTFDAPETSGEWVIRLELDRTEWSAVSVPLSVRGDLETTFDGPVGAFDLVEVRRPTDVHRASQWPMTIRIRNRGDRVWLARSECDVPPDRGAVEWKVRYTEWRPSRTDPKVVEYVLTQDNHHYLLPHDLAPGDEVVTRISMRAPRSADEYSMAIGVGALHVTPPSDWTVAELERPLTVR